MNTLKPKKLGITEVVLRDGNQSLLATRIKIEDLLPIACALDQIGYWSIESWGGATFDACLRYLNEDPWERLRLFREAMPNTKQQMLLRGQNLLGYKHFPDSVVEKFINKSSENGIDVFRIFDALNDINNLEFSIKQVKENSKHAQAAMAYTVSPVHKIDYWLDLAKKFEDLDVDSIAIKDMSGILKPYVAFEMISKLKEIISVPIHMQTHATAGLSTATNLKAVEAGIDNLDTSISSMSLTYGHSPTESIVASFEDSERATGLDLSKLQKVADYFKNVRVKYSEFEGSLKGVDTQMLSSQVPGGMLSNLESQLKELNKTDLFENVIKEIPKVRKDLGFPPLVTPVSQIVGAQAMMNVSEKESYKNLSKETINLATGYYGKLPGRINDELLELVEKNQETISVRPADLIEDDMEERKKDLKNFCVQNNLKDFSEHEEYLLCFIQFPYSTTDYLKSLA
ncbi:MAG: oxaloacetate decarboxylase [Proteobacteria bacterium]|nr:oxaloacetate decarboxylase [Pseudomonadota bacterium]RZO99220.1 MAG: pyruvate carboxylase subunit B [Gammaproteobacteria bacterium]|tara:strand:- start:5262 stop:6632 length:1371 start_codon:yes stop_codon:yes gene_type:complete